MEIFGFDLTLKKRQKEEEDKISFVAPENDDGATTVTTSVDSFNGQMAYFDMDGVLKNEIELITRYREMSMYPEVQSAIEDIVNEAIVVEENQETVELVLDEVENVSKNIKNKINEEFKTIIELLEFNDKSFDRFQKWYIDGRQYFHVIVDKGNKKRGILELRYIDPRKIRKIRVVEETPNQTLTLQKVKEEFFVFSEHGFLDNVKGNIISYKEYSNLRAVKIDLDAIIYVTSGLVDSANKMVLSYLHKAIKPMNQLRMMEDAVVIYRITRAPERRIFYIEVGDLPKAKAEQHIRDMMVKHKNRLVYDTQTGNIKDDRKMLTMTDDYWFSRRNGSGGTQVETLPGGQNLGELDELQYFLSKLMKALNVPISRTESGSSFSFGRPSEITRDEIKFNKFVKRLRHRYSQVFTLALEKQVLLKNIVTWEEWQLIKKNLKYRFLNDNQFEELKNLEILRERIGVLDQIDNHVGTYFSKDYVKKNILQQTDEEIKEITLQIEKEGDEYEDDAETKVVRGITPDMTDDEDSGLEPKSPGSSPTVKPQVLDSKSDEDKNDETPK